jgi:hypothetical protein
MGDHSMGSISFYTYDEAANRLGKSKRSIFNYVKKGYIKSLIREGRPVLNRDYVEQFSIEMGADLPAMNRMTFLQMAHRIEKLEHEMTTVKHILEIRDEPLRPSDAEISGIYNAAQTYLAAGAWTDQHVDQWVGLFERMDEVFLEKLISATREPKAWVPIYELCIRMNDLAQKHGASSLTWQARAHRLGEGRKKLRGTIIMWTEMGRGTTSEVVLKGIDDLKESLLRKVAAS